jgi:hypothetical protein
MAGVLLSNVATQAERKIPRKGPCKGSVALRVGNATETVLVAQSNLRGCQLGALSSLSLAYSHKL